MDDSRETADHNSLGVMKRWGTFRGDLLELNQWILSTPAGWISTNWNDMQELRKNFISFVNAEAAVVNARAAMVLEARRGACS